MMQQLRQLGRRVAVMINRNVFDRVSKGGTKNQLWLVRGLSDQDKEVEVFEPYGLSSHPPKDAELLRFALDGHEEHSVALGATGGVARPRNLAPGEVRIYSSSGQFIQLNDNDQSIVLQSGGNSLTLDNDKLVIKIGGNTLTMTAFTLTNNGVPL